MIIDFPQKLIRKNHSSSYPSCMLFIDSETDQEKVGKAVHHSMKIAWTAFVDFKSNNGFDNPVYKLWYHPYQLCSYIHGKARSQHVLYIFAHNVFFDLQIIGFYHFLTKWGWILEFVYDKQLTYILTISNAKKKIKAVSTTNFFETSLDKLGEMLGLKKLKVDFDTVTENELISYCKRDTEIIVKAMKQYMAFLKDNHLGKFCLTKSSQAMQAFRHRFMEHKMYVHQWPEAVDIERQAYFGGRCECFHFGEVPGGPFVSLDVNSMYPYVMRNKRIPTRLVDFVEYPSLEDAKWIIKKFCVSATVKLNTDQPMYAKRHNGKTVFPVGKFNTAVCSDGLFYALSRGHILEIESMCVYEQGFVFKNYIDFFYPLKALYKKQKNAIWVYLIKKMLNSLYGKFGQKYTKTEERKDITYDGYSRSDVWDLVTGEKGVEYKLFNKIVLEMGEDEGRNSLVTVAAHITEYARFYLWTLMERVGLDNVLYCDTDSLKIRKKHLPAFKDKLNEYELGMLGIEETFEHFTINGLKSYVTEHHTKIKGIPRKAKKIDDFKYQYTSFLGQVSHMRKQEDRNIITQQIVKEALPSYDKGVIQSDNTIVPIYLKEF